MKASKMKLGISYIDTRSPLHSLNGITKFVLFMAWVTVVLTTFDLRLISALILVGVGLLRLTRVPFAAYRSLLMGTATVLMLNALFMFLLAPQQGTEIIGSNTLLMSLPFGYSLTSETVFYLLTITLKYFSMFPIALVFVFSTHPTEFAASLNRIGVPYKVAYAVSLTIRYLPEVQKDFVHILHAQQARGVELSGKASLLKRIKNVSRVLGPLIFSSLDRADEISNAMTLRGFGRHISRSWYSQKKMTATDICWLIGITLVTVFALIKHLVEQQAFWYPYS
ncbi:energy-coupling factor transporter transmembrane component T family protein [Veronia pacifica]|uniref:Energy-coupling factor transporter transmembrane protein EcfT n=1 Tax=Veronia pacifica TaxID=1080227 RepID=A0A1C3EBA4_9GAMM|nr:energy-coupling factor transporter transmembrane component T [Veronia pacifica]ODA30480.1 hypothetical protein A8L45_20300 [Veronia pacifica]